MKKAISIFYIKEDFDQCKENMRYFGAICFYIHLNGYILVRYTIYRASTCFYEAKSHTIRRL